MRRIWNALFALLAAGLVLEVGAVHAAVAAPMEVQKVSAPSQDSDCSCTGWIDDDQLGGGGVVTDPGVPDSPDSGGGRRSGPTAYWTMKMVPSRNGNLGRVILPERCLTADGRGGGAFDYTLRSAATGEEIRTERRCVPNEEDASPEAQGFTDPPTVEQLWDMAQIPAPEVRINPAGRGLTGLESWFWAEDPGEVAVDDSALGWNVSASVNVTQWRWEMGDGGEYTTDGAGSEQDPAVAHMYESKDTWTVTVTATWEGSFTVSNPTLGISFEVPGLQTEQSTSIDYEVIEVVAVPDDPREERT